MSSKFVPYRPNYDLVGSATNALFSTAFNTVTSVSTYVKNIEGGYIQIGNLVVVNVRCTVNVAIPSSTAFIDGLPKPLIQYNAGYGGASASNNKHYSISVIGTGSLAYGGNDPIPVNDTLIINAVYLAK